MGFKKDPWETPKELEVGVHKLFAFGVIGMKVG